MKFGPECRITGLRKSWKWIFDILIFFPRCFNFSLKMTDLKPKTAKSRKNRSPTFSYGFLMLTKTVGTLLPRIQVLALTYESAHFYEWAGGFASHAPSYSGISACTNIRSTYTVKIHDSALGLPGFVSFFWWAYLRGGAYPRRIYRYVLWAYLTKLTFLEKLICGCAYVRGALSRIFTVCHCYWFHATF